MLAKLLIGFLGINMALAGRPDTLAISTDSSRRVVISSVTFNGNQRTRDRILQRDMMLHPGDTLPLADLPGRMAWSRRNLHNTNLFVTVEIDAQPRTRPDSVRLQQMDVTVRVHERWYWLGYPLVELGDRNLNEWWYDRHHDLRRLLFGFRLTHANLTGVNDRLQVVVERGFWQRTLLSYTIPYLDKAQKIGLRVEGGFQTNKELAYRAELDKWLYVRDDAVLRQRAWAGLTLTHRRGLYHYHSLNLNYLNIGLADTIARLNPNYLPDGRTRQALTSLTYGYRYDRRDNVAYPLRGTLLMSSVGVSGIGPAESFRMGEAAASVSRYWPIGGRFYGALHLSSRVSWPSQQPFAYLRGIGLRSDMVRGYELYVINGQHVAVGRSSWRFQLFDTVKNLNWLRIRQFNKLPLAAYLTVFADAGYVRSSVARQYNSLLSNRLLAGTGLSLDVVTYYNVVMRLSGTLNREGDRHIFLNLAREF